MNQIGGRLKVTGLLSDSPPKVFHERFCAATKTPADSIKIAMKYVSVKGISGLGKEVAHGKKRPVRKFA